MVDPLGSLTWMWMPDGTNVGGRSLERRKKSVDPESARAREKCKSFWGVKAGVV